MPNALTSTGLVLKTRDELVSDLTDAFRSIYGPDINLDQDSPDGQMMMIFVQSILDTQDLFMQIYNSFDPDNAIGAVLDQRVAINGIQRQAGTYTLTDISITTDRAATLYGLDQELYDPFTVADNAGNQWLLVNSIAIGAAGTASYQFRAANPGAVLTVPNTITVPVSVVLGVTAINNPTTYSVLGINEESDAELKVRRQKSVALSSQGYRDGLLAALQNLTGVSSAFVYENTTGTTDGNGVPGHSIWVIVAGTATDAEIANAIYTKRNAGCGMKGTQQYIIHQADGTSFVVSWDNVASETLYIKFTVTSLDGVNPPNVTAIKAGLVEMLAPGVAETVNVNQLSSLIQLIDPNALVTFPSGAGFCLTSGGTFTAKLTPSAKNKQFLVDQANMTVTVV